MFKKVLVALDFSAYSQKILDRITEIPGITEVVLLHVVDATAPSRTGWIHEPQIANAKILMAEKKEALEHLGLTIRIRVDVIVNTIAQGTVATAILETAETENASLIVVGARGLNPIQELLLGSVSSTVLRHATMNILIVRYTTMAPARLSDQRLFSRVLVPTDFSRHADDVVSVIKTIREIPKADLLYVVSHAETKEEIEESVAKARTQLAKRQRDLESVGIAADLRIRIGDPTEMILSVAEEDDVSLIAMNAHGTDWLRNLILGSTTSTVVRRTKKSVLIVRKGQSKTP